MDSYVHIRVWSCAEDTSDDVNLHFIYLWTIDISLKCDEVSIYWKLLFVLW